MKSGIATTLIAISMSLALGAPTQVTAQDSPPHQKTEGNRHVVGNPAIGEASSIHATAQTSPGVGIVMTYNVNEGSDFLQVQGVTTLQQFLLGVGQITTQVQGTNPPERGRVPSFRAALLRAHLTRKQGRRHRLQRELRSLRHQQ